MRRLAMLSLAAAALLAPAAGCSKLLSDTGPDHRPKDHLVISHQVHIEQEVDCWYCHEGVEEAKDFSQSFLPKEEACMMCHDEDKAQGKCGMCHSDAENPSYTYPDEEHHLKMSHAAHMERVDGDCSRCHDKLPEPDRPAQPPAMDRCLSCHEHQQQYDALKCDSCHRDLVAIPLKPVSMFSHEGDYVAQHRLNARAAPEMCLQCHDQTHCADCHAETVATRLSIQFGERLDRTFIHRNDWVSRHTVEARADPAMCQRCHGTSFCDSCHQLQNLTPLASDPRSPHPEGYAFPTSAQFHGTEARQDIVRCAACHDQGARSVCVDCHQVGGVGGDPHPAGWTDRHGVSEIASNSMCRYCHL